MGGTYSEHYTTPTKKLVEDVQKYIEKRVDIILPFTIHRISKLTKDPEGYNIWLDVCNFIFETTGKVIQHKKTKDSKGNLLPYNIKDKYLYIPEGDVEAAIHDMCHWIVSSIEERAKDNCGMDNMTEIELIRKEELAWSLETWIFSAIISEPDLVDMVSPHAEIETFHYWVRVNDPVTTTIKALNDLKTSFANFNITLLRRILANWVQWKEKNPSEDAMPRGCLGWNQIGLSIPTTDIMVQPIGYVKSGTEFSNKLKIAVESANENEFKRKL